METETSKLPQLSPEEIRVLGALIEKSKTTPDYYPLTLNGLVTACNQKSSRSPVVNYDNDTVISTLDTLRKKELSAKVIGDGRALKYRNTLAVKYPLDPAETAVLSLLFLRGPLTAGEINSNSGRLHDFEGLNEVQTTLQQLMEYEPPFVHHLEKVTGQKEGRYCHLFAEIPDVEELKQNELEVSGTKTNQLEDRLELVERQLSELQIAFDNLMKELS
ncbi:MAG: hypothetical protein ACI837_001244 [Crocinitomicaceae bacterium]|jgi:uncharacterized protein YceH (UPF0502 family)